MILNAGWMKEGVPLHIVSSTIAGLANAMATTPIDIGKTRIMNQPTGILDIDTSELYVWLCLLLI